jgi:hypothetical protein
MYLAAVLDENGNPVNTSTIMLGDRVRVESLRLADGKILITMLAHAPDDPLCCPTQKAENTYQVDGGQLVPLDNE